MASDEIRAIHADALEGNEASTALGKEGEGVFAMLEVMLVAGMAHWQE